MSSINSISIKTAARKLPIKRKSPELPNPNPNFIPKSESHLSEDDDDDEEETTLDTHKPPPFKFHRIWTESDEIRFLQGLLDSSSQGMIFPRDLHLFYQRFAKSMSQPYTKSQLSEKLRRLRKKFRVISNRISQGLDPSLLSEQDRSLFQLSKELWDPNYASRSPFNVNKRLSSVKVSSKPASVASVATVATVDVNVSFNPAFAHDVNVSFDPSFAPPPMSSSIPDSTDDDDLDEVEIDHKVENLNEEELNSRNSELVKGLVVKTVMDVFENSLNEVRMTLLDRGSSNSDGSPQQAKVDDLMKRCQEQRLAELDLLAKHTRLVLENSSHDD